MFEHKAWMQSMQTLYFQTDICFLDPEGKVYILKNELNSKGLDIYHIHSIISKPGLTITANQNF